MSRVIMSIIPHGWEWDVTLRIKPKRILASFYYLDTMKEDKIHEVFSTLRELGITSLIDSGIFSLKSKYGKGIFSLGASHESLSPEMQQQVIDAFKKDIKRYSDFKDRYLQFLAKYQDEFDWAIDLDVDQFLGLDIAEEWYREIIKIFPTNRLLKVWHSSSRTFADWKNWCDSGKYTYLAIEGANSHGYNPHFYDKFVSYAHEKSVMVHILAMTSLDLLNKVPFDTGDSTTYQVGARFGQIQTPWGFIYLSEVGKDIGGKKLNYFQLPSDEQNKIKNLLLEHGFSIDSMLESNHQKKSQAGIERSAWNMYFQENFFGGIVAKDDGKQLSIFDF